MTNANFLQYVESGAYDASIIHRSLKSYDKMPLMLQGGGFRQPTSKADMPGSDPAPIETGEPVQREQHFGNVRGTIAMARLYGRPNSATSQFFFNVENNNYLDSDDGGYTVFGKVLDTGIDD